MPHVPTHRRICHISPFFTIIATELRDCRWFPRAAIFLDGRFGLFLDLHRNQCIVIYGKISGMFMPVAYFYKMTQLQIYIHNTKMQGSNFQDQILKTYVQKVFDKYDTDKSGTLDQQQMTIFFNQLFQSLGINRQVSGQESLEAIKSIDKNFDGSVSKDELLIAFKAMLMKSQMQQQPQQQPQQPPPYYMQQPYPQPGYGYGSGYGNGYGSGSGYGGYYPPPPQYPYGGYPPQPQPGYGGYYPQSPYYPQQPMQPMYGSNTQPMYTPQQQQQQQNMTHSYNLNNSNNSTGQNNMNPNPYLTNSANPYQKK